jgi:integrase/recombinase XerD
VTWRELVEGYLAHVGRLGFAPRTIDGHQKYLDRLVSWSDEAGLSDPRSVTRENLLSFLATSCSPRLNAQSRNQRLGILKRFFLWATLEGHLLASPAREIEYARVEETLVDYLRPDELARLLKSCDTGTAEGLRDRAILETLYSTALRLGELCALNLGDVDRDAGIVSVWKGKGSKDRKAPIGSLAVKLIDRYIATTRRPNDLSERALFLGLRGERLCHVVVEGMLRRRVKAIGLAKRVYPHLLRHTCAVHLLENGADIRYIQELLGHASLRTTQRYTRVLPMALKRAHARSHPAERRRGPAPRLDPTQYYRSKPIPPEDREDEPG